MMRAALLAALLVTARLAVAEDGAGRRLAVIVSPSSPWTDLSSRDLHRISLGSMARWPSGHRITLVVMGSKTWEQRAFLKRIAHMTDIDYAQLWIGEVFRGRAARPPHVAASAADAIRFVSSHPHAIAVIDAAAVDASVRMLAIDGKAPESDEYPLRLTPDP